MDKPDVDFIEGLSPAVSIDQKSTSRNPRSTVGTITEVYDYLRLLYARIGHPHCPIVRRADRPADAAADRRPGARAARRAPGSRCSPRWSAGARASTSTCSRSCRPRATPRVRSTASCVALTEPPMLKKQEKHDIEVVVDRLVGQGDGQAAAHRLGRDRARAGRRAWSCSTSSTCPRTTRTASGRSPSTSPAPTTACSSRSSSRARSRSTPRTAPARSATGLGTTDGGRPRAGRPRPRRVPGRRRDRPVVRRAHARVLRALLDAPRRGHRVRHRRRRGSSCPPRRGKAVLHGHDEQVARAVQEPLRPRARVLHRRSRASSRTSSAGTPRPRPTPRRERFEGYMRQVPCPACGGARLKPIVARRHHRRGKIIAEVAAMPIGEAARLPRRARPDRARGGRSPSGCSRRSTSGCGSCSTSASTTSRSTARRGTLAGGEAQRIRLATQIGSGLVGVLYVLDEPSASGCTSATTTGSSRRWSGCATSATP